MFLTAEGASSDDGTGLSEEEGEGAEAPGHRKEERPAWAKAPGSQQEVEPPGPTLGPGGRRTKVKAGMGRVGRSVAVGRPCKLWRRPALSVARTRALRPPHH